MTSSNRHVSHRIPQAARAALFALFTLSGTFAHADASTVSIVDIQSTVDASGGSLYVGQEVTIAGTVTATSYNGFTVAEAPGAWAAISIYTQAAGPDVGDEVQFSGIVFEYYGMTMMQAVDDFVHLSSDNPVVATPVAVGAASQEQYEAVLLTVQDVTVASLLDYGIWAVMDEAFDFVLCDVMNDYMYFPREGDHLDSITGVLFYTYGAFKIEPRGTKDIVGDVYPHYALRGDVVTMNDAREVIRNAYVEVYGDEIVAIHRRRPAGMTVIPVHGLIFPGLIDSHNHQSFNVLDTIPFQTTFEDRYQWRITPEYLDFKDQLAAIKHHGGYYAQGLNIYRFAEMRALSAGTTSIQGSNCNSYEDGAYAAQGILVDNVERFPARVHHNTFPFWESYEFWAEKHGQYWDRFLVHLAEGTNQESLDEFHTWQSLGMLDGRTTVIHGIPLGTPEWTAMANVGSSLIWSPQSNLTLYGQTADVPGALAAGVNVALAPDWTESGSTLARRVEGRGSLRQRALGRQHLSAAVRRVRHPQRRPGRGIRGARRTDRSRLPREPDGDPGELEATLPFASARDPGRREADRRQRQADVRRLAPDAALRLPRGDRIRLDRLEAEDVGRPGGFPPHPGRRQIVRRHAGRAPGSLRRRAAEHL